MTEPSRSRIPLAGALGFGFLVFALLAGLVHGVPRSSDYEIFLRAGQRALTGEGLYQVNDGIFPFKYHPSMALPWALWSLLPKVFAKALFELLQTTMTMVALYWWVRRLIRPEARRLAFGLITLAALKMIWREDDLGQINGTMFLGATLVVAAVEQGRQVLAGLLAALLTLTKLNYALLAVAVVAAGPSAVFGGLLGVLTAVVAVWSWFGLQGGLALHGEWLRLLFGVSKTQLLDMENQGLMHAFYAAFQPQSYGLWLAAAALWAGTAAWLVRRPGDRAVAWVFVLFGVNFLSPLAWWNQYLLAMPMLLFVARDARRGSTWTKRAAYACLAPVAVLLVLFHYDTFGRAIYNHGMQSQWFTVGMGLLLLSFGVVTVLCRPNRWLSGADRPGQAPRSRPHPVG